MKILTISQIALNEILKNSQKELGQSQIPEKINANHPPLRILKLNHR